MTWTLTYTLANGPVTNAVITDPIPAGLSYVAGSASNGGVYDSSSRTLTWTFATPFCERLCHLQDHGGQQHRWRRELHQRCDHQVE